MKNKIYRYHVSYTAEIEAANQLEAEEKLSEFDLPNYSFNSMEICFIETKEIN